MVNIGTGVKGFLGSHLLQKVEVSSIPHEAIHITKLLPFDVFYFFSAYGNMSDQTDMKKTVQANVLDLIHILDQAVKCDFKSFVFISTSSVKLRMHTAYSRTKRAAEELLLAYMERYKKPILIIRPFTICGVGDNPKHLIPTIIRSCMTGEQMNFVPEPTHDYIDADDVIDGIQTLVKFGAKGIFELGSGKSTTNKQVLEIVEKVTGKKANINVVQSMRVYDNENWVSTNYRARGFGWFPKKALEQSITEMVEAYE